MRFLRVSALLFSLARGTGGLSPCVVVFIHRLLGTIDLNLAYAVTADGVAVKISRNVTTGYRCCSHLERSIFVFGTATSCGVELNAGDVGSIGFGYADGRS